MKKIIFLLLILCNFAYSFCSVSTGCESDLQQMSQDIQDKIDDEFDKLDDSIEDVSKTYVKINKELDKEISVLEIALKGEILLYRKLYEIDFVTKQSFQIKDIDLSMLYNINNSLKKRKNNEQK